MARKVADLVVRKAGLFPHDRAIEVGAGAGLASVPLARAFTRCRVVAAEDRAAALERLRLNARTEGADTRLDIVQANAEALPYPDETFHFGVAAFAFSRFSDPVAAMEELHRVVAYFGKVLLIDVDLRGAPARRGLARWALSDALAERMREVGYAKIQRQRIDFLSAGVVVEALSAKRMDPEGEDEDEHGDQEEEGELGEPAERAGKGRDAQAR